MTQASEDILESVVLIYSTHGKEFGTGFAIHAEHGATWILTCAHVVRQVEHAGANAIRVLDDKVAEVVACGKEQEADLAVLRVADLELPPLKLGLVGRNTMACGIAGYAKLTGEARRAEPLSATLGSNIRIVVPGGLPFKAWKLSIEGDTHLQEGYSGSPVVCTATRTVFAVASHEAHQGERGYAISLGHLREIWPAMPVGLVSPEPHTSAWLAQEQRDVLEDLFRTLNVPLNQLRAWCHDAMPHDVPHMIAANSSALDLMQWLIDRGQLADGQVPLLHVLHHLSPVIGDAETRQALETCCQIIAETFGVSDIGSLPESATSETQTSPSLMLEIWPKAPPGNLCNVQGRLFYSPDRIFTICVRERENALNLDDEDDLIELVEDLRGILSERGVDEKQVMVEFILARDLLSQSVDQWPDAVGDPVGTYLPVVVRPRERFQDRRQRLSWQTCWNTLLDHQEQLFLDWLWWWFDESQRREVRGKLQEGTCIALRFVPDLLAPPRQNAVLYLLHHGTSVALWPRREAGRAELVQQLQTFAAGNPLKDLPDVIRSMRYKLWADNQEQDPGYNLTLLWDDPTRRLPERPQNDDEFFQAPV